MCKYEGKASGSGGGGGGGGASLTVPLVAVVSTALLKAALAGEKRCGDSCARLLGRCLKAHEDSVSGGLIAAAWRPGGKHWRQAVAALVSACRHAAATPTTTAYCIEALWGQVLKRVPSLLGGLTDCKLSKGALDRVAEAVAEGVEVEGGAAPPAPGSCAGMEGIASALEAAAGRRNMCVPVAADGSAVALPVQLLGLLLTARRKAAPDTPACSSEECSRSVFGVFNPRHACRVCGERKCGACVVRVGVGGLGLGDKPARVCRGCRAGGALLFKDAFLGQGRALRIIDTPQGLSSVVVEEEGATP